MPIALVRIDDRLIHGQVVEGWIPALDASRVIVVSDEAAADPTQTALMQLAVPDSVRLEVLTVRQAAPAIRSAAESPDRVLVLAPGPAQVLALLDAGLRFPSVNVGGLHHAAGRMQIGKAIFISEDDSHALEAIVAHGVALEGRAVPSETPSDVAARVRSSRLMNA